LLSGAELGARLNFSIEHWSHSERLLIWRLAIMWAGPFVFGKAVGLGYGRTTTLAFTAAGNNFELAIAVAIATFSAASGQVLAGVVGPLIKVPVLVALVYVSLWARRFFRTP